MKRGAGKWAWHATRLRAGDPRFGDDMGNVRVTEQQVGDLAARAGLPHDECLVPLGEWPKYSSRQTDIEIAVDAQSQDVSYLSLG
jgi:hypothetical protein